MMKRTGCSEDRQTEETALRQEAARQSRTVQACVDKFMPALPSSSLHWPVQTCIAQLKPGLHSSSLH